MAYLQNVPQDELLALRESSTIIRAILQKIEKTPFCAELKPYQSELISLLDNLSDTCIDNLLLDDEYKQLQHDISDDRDYRDQVRSTYFYSVL